MSCVLLAVCTGHRGWRLATTQYTLQPSGPRVDGAAAGALDGGDAGALGRAGGEVCGEDAACVGTKPSLVLSETISSTSRLGGVTLVYHFNKLRRLIDPEIDLESNVTAE